MKFLSVIILLGLLLHTNCLFAYFLQDYADINIFRSDSSAIFELFFNKKLDVIRFLYKFDYEIVTCHNSPWPSPPHQLPLYVLPAKLP